MKTDKLTPTIEQYIIDCINPEGYDVNPQTEAEKLQFLVDTFNKEKPAKYHGNNTKARFIDWCQGLPSSFNLDYENYQILNICYLFGLMPANATEQEEDLMIEKWWAIIYFKVAALCLKHKINL